MLWIQEELIMYILEHVTTDLSTPLGKNIFHAVCKNSVDSIEKLKLCTIQIYLPL